MPNSLLTLEPIGIIRTPYEEKYHAPRQPGAAHESITGTITLFPDKNFDQALEDLSGFDRIWIIYWFHKNNDWKPKVLPPRSGRKKKGVFATRSPHRPNPVGLSLCKLIEVKGRTIIVENPDLLDGTPILDIKPYIPYADAFPDSKVGWLEEVESRADPQYSVKISALAEEQSEFLKNKFDIHILERVTDVLAHDPFPHSYRRIKKLGDSSYSIGVKSWRVFFEIKGNTVTINKIESGYPHSAIADAKRKLRTLHDQEAHLKFHALWHANR